MPSRVLVTGVSGYLGGHVARRLEQRADVEAIFGVDIADPGVALERTEFVHADTRQSFLTKLVRQLELDTVIHCAVLTDSPASARTVHETNVIGTMNVLAACSGPQSPVERMVVKSGVAIYGNEPYDPSFLTEDMAARRPTRFPIARDLVEMEQLVQDHALRSQRASVTVLRLGYRLGAGHRSPLTAYFSQVRVPRFAGYDPRIQLLHEEDAIEAVYRAAVADHPGTFNVAAPGVLLLSQLIGLSGKRDLPVLPPLGISAGRLLLRALTGIDMPDDMVNFLANGSVIDLDRLQDEFGWLPGHETREVMLDFVDRKGRPDPDAVPPPDEGELQAYLRRRRRRAS